MTRDNQIPEKYLYAHSRQKVNPVQAAFYF
jgi:hypothetical protein